MVSIQQGGYPQQQYPQQNYAPAQQQHAANTDPWDFINQGGKKSLAWVTKDAYGRSIDVPVGTAYTVQVIEIPKVQQQLDFETKQPKYYSDGNPMMMLAVEVQTDLREDTEDDGTRMIYLRNQSLRALQDEMRRLGVKQFGIGTVMQMTLVDLKPTSKGNPQKIFDIKLQPTPLSNPQADALLAPPQAPQAAPQGPQGGYQAPYGAPVPQVPAQPQGWYQEPPQAPQQAPVQQPAPSAPPVQQFAPQAPQAPAYGAPVVQQLLGAQEIPQSPQAAPQGLPVPDSSGLVAQVENLVKLNIARDAAIAAVANGDAGMAGWLEQNVPF